MAAQINTAVPVSEYLICSQPFPEDNQSRESSYQVIPKISSVTGRLNRVKASADNDLRQSSVGHETIDIAVKAFELSQRLRDRWVTADYDAKRRILEIVCLNCKLVDASLVVTMRKPFDLLVEGLVSKDSRGERI